MDDKSDKCDKCGKPATVHFIKIVNGQKMKMNLCADCAKDSMFLPDGVGLPPELLPEIEKLASDVVESAKIKRVKIPSVTCSVCGTSMESLDKGGRFGCANCYEAFKAKVLDMLAHMHGSLEHLGKSPKSLKKSKKVLVQAVDSAQAELPLGLAEKEPAVKDIEIDIPPAQLNLLDLKIKLESAVKDERYEDAALIRDKIKEIENS